MTGNLLSNIEAAEENLAVALGVPVGQEDLMTLSIDAKAEIERLRAELAAGRRQVPVLPLQTALYDQWLVDVLSDQQRHRLEAAVLEIFSGTICEHTGDEMLACDECRASMIRVTVIEPLMVRLYTAWWSARIGRAQARQRAATAEAQALLLAVEVERHQTFAPAANALAERHRERAETAEAERGRLRELIEDLATIKPSMHNDHEAIPDACRFCAGEARALAKIRDRITNWLRAESQPDPDSCAAGDHDQVPYE